MTLFLVFDSIAYFHFRKYFTMITLSSKLDCQDIAVIYNNYLGKATMDLEPKDGAYYSKILDHQDDMEELWSLKKGEKLIAWGIIKKYSDRAGYRLTGETSVYVHPDHLHEGHGTLLKKHLIKRCKALGYHHLLARINSDNHISIHYNKKLGYTIVGEQIEVGRINDTWKDITIMQYILD